ncbi:hypothetical protein SN15_03910 [Stenotrophomonas maltophilia]|nr:hypothetical protein SN15_03910 [Stenotrophomonas maltophilia]
MSTSIQIDLQVTATAVPTPHEDELVGLPPLATVIVDRAIDNMTRKLVAGYRNKGDSKKRPPHAPASAETVMEVANRGQAWKEMIQKTFTHGISSIDTLKFDGDGFRVEGGMRPEGFKDKMPATPGVYVVFDNNDRPVYIGDSDNMQRRWDAGHFNEHKQGKRPGGTPYKLEKVFDEGCTVKFVKMETKETAAALEAHLIQANFNNYDGIKKKDNGRLTPEQQAARDEALQDGMLLNQRPELATEQGTRSNKEAKKIKDAAGTAASLAAGAAGEAFKNVGFDVFERLTTTAIKAIRDELVDVVMGGKAALKVRVERMLKKIMAVLRKVLDNPLQLLRGIVEFVVNALSKAIGQIYNLARNIFDLANNSWQLYKGAQTMSREQLVRTLSETIVTSGSLVVWDSLDLMLEKWLTAQSGGVLMPFAPYISAAVTAVGFGVSTFALQAIVTRAIDAVVAFKQGHIELIEVERAACEQLILVAEQELELVAELGAFVQSEVIIHEQLALHTQQLSHHEAIQPIDLAALSISRS